MTSREPLHSKGYEMLFGAVPHTWLTVVGELIGERFFLSQVESREPLANGGHQQLHRDLSAQRPGDTVNALVYLDDYGPENGATRIVTGSHRPALDEPPFDFTDESRSVQLTGNVADILIFDADVIHAGSLNASGARRRTLLITFFPTRSLQNTWKR